MKRSLLLLLFGWMETHAIKIRTIQFMVNVQKSLINIYLCTRRLENIWEKILINVIGQICDGTTTIITIKRC